MMPQLQQQHQPPMLPPTQVRVGVQPASNNTQPLRHPPTAPPQFSSNAANAAFGNTGGLGSPLAAAAAVSPTWDAMLGSPGSSRVPQQPTSPEIVQHQQQQAFAFAQHLQNVSGSPTPVNAAAPSPSQIDASWARVATPTTAQPTAGLSGASTGNRVHMDPLASTQAPPPTAAAVPQPQPSKQQQRRRSSKVKDADVAAAAAAAAGGGGGAGPELDFESTLNDMTLRTATATIASMEDFLSGVPAATEDPHARKIIDDLRKEVTDKVIRSKLMRLPKETCESLVAVLEGDTHLLMVQCVKERGNIIAPLVEKLGPETTFTLIRFLLDHYTEAAKSMGGCIAIPRILPHIKASQLDVFFDTTMAAFGELVGHEYGNFVVKHFAGIQRYSERIADEAFGDPSAMARYCTTKAGSHAVEELLSNATPTAVAKLCRVMLATSPETCKRLAHDRFGNYCVQAAFKALTDRVDDCELHGQCAQMTSRCARDSPFAQNIMKRVAQGFRKYKSPGTAGHRQGTSPTNTADRPGTSTSTCSPPSVGVNNHNTRSANTSPAGLAGTGGSRRGQRGGGREGKLRAAGNDEPHLQQASHHAADGAPLSVFKGDSAATTTGVSMAGVPSLRSVTR
jgi:hypothetical protein